MIPDVDPWVVAAELVAQSGAVAARVAVEAGASMQVAYALDQAVTVLLWGIADAQLGIPAAGSAEFERMVDARIAHPDWPVLADQASEPVDEDAWSAFADSLPSLKPSHP
ncbi:hypothetical protein [Methylobacterium sp. Leaf91]|uniref:hypothetical protein n=1 Tax=Methylobacterium sp. Leaf91 TaxID=1736247 RepID=UPI0006F1E72F|nr:hypothetical protein [Methylobacterium sp. Leaf91]KQO93330.1 hypothetical protein ASF32_03645 [Methylobacterium sp. Leaf91]